MRQQAPRPTHHSFLLHATTAGPSVKEVAGSHRRWAALLRDCTYVKRPRDRRAMGAGGVRVAGLPRGPATGLGRRGQRHPRPLSGRRRDAGRASSHRVGPSRSPGTAKTDRPRQRRAPRLRTRVRPPNRRPSRRAAVPQSDSHSEARPDAGGSRPPSPRPRVCCSALGYAVLPRIGPAPRRCRKGTSPRAPDRDCRIAGRGGVRLPPPAEPPDHRSLRLHVAKDGKDMEGAAAKDRPNWRFPDPVVLACADGLNWAGEHLQ